MGFIYLITNLKNWKQYVGQTTNKDPQKRWKEHKRSAKYIIRVIQGLSEYDPMNTNQRSIMSSYLYLSMVKYGIENFDFEVLQEEPDEDLNKWEIYCIKELDTIIPNGYNMTSGGSSKYKHAPESIQKMINRKRETLDNNRNEILLGCPPSATYCKKLDAIILVKHERCNYKTFSVTTYGSIESARDACIKFIAELESDNDVHILLKKENDLAIYPGLKATKKGYKLEKYINGFKHRAGFESQKFTREENKQSAIKYYLERFEPKTPPQAKLLTKINSPPIVCSSTTKW